MNYIAYNGIYNNERSKKMENENVEILRQEQKEVREKRRITLLGSDEYFKLLELEERLQKQIDAILREELNEREQALAEKRLEAESEEKEIQIRHEKRGRIFDAVVKIGVTLLMIGGSIGVAFLQDAFENPGDPTDPKLGRVLKEVGRTIRGRIIK